MGKQGCKTLSANTPHNTHQNVPHEILEKVANIDSLSIELKIKKKTAGEVGGGGVLKEQAHVCRILNYKLYCC